MRRRLSALGRHNLHQLAMALQSGQLSPPFTGRALHDRVPSDAHDAVQSELQELHSQGMQPPQLAVLLDALAAERDAQEALRDRVELVLSPPELDHAGARDSWAVVQSLFQRAQRALVILSYAFDHGDKAKDLFGPLAARMDAEPELAVTICAHVRRPMHDPTDEAALRADFARRFAKELWPGERLPALEHFPRSLSLDFTARAAMHAKLVVADARWSLITSANFTEAAQLRNLEAGVVIDDPDLAGRLLRHLDALRRDGELQPLPTA